ncbi:MAG TPA: diacylglycerol kinase family protein [Gemmatirosa sp.]
MDVLTASGARVGGLPARALLVVNPVARRSAAREAQAVDAFARAGVACDVRRTEAPGHAAELARALVLDAVPADRPAYDAVFTLGGDGTAMDVVGALAGSGIAVGVLPGGTGNLVARTLGIPLGTARAVAALLAGTRTRIDLGALRRTGVDAADAAAPDVPARLFAFAAGVGVDARMIEGTSAVWKRRVGVLAYVVTAARAVIARERFTARVVVDGDEVRAEASAVIVANFGAVLGDLFRFGPDIREDDGRLDVCIFQPTSFASSAGAFLRLVRKDFRPHAALVYRAGRTIAIETDPPRPVQADGELLGRTPFIVEVRPLAATLLVPRTPLASHA